MKDRILAFLAPGLKPGREYFWTKAEASLWVDACRAKDLLIHGMKKVVDEWGKDDRPLTLDAMQNVFDPVALAELDGIVSRCELGEALQWLDRHLLDSKSGAAAFPMAVMKRDMDEVEKTPGLYVGTVHSFKGAEADTVILLPDLSRPWDQAWNGGDRDSVVRLFYVAATRAKETLILCQPAGRMAVNLMKYKE